jgi:hypothetical protein
MDDMARNEYMAKWHPAYNYPEKYDTVANEFMAAYGLELHLGCPDAKMTGLKPSRDRICRFCGQKYPTVTFRRDAHRISEFLGNRYLVYDSECDSCNLKFGVYEDNLSKFLGIDRTMLGIKGKDKIPKFKSPGERLILDTTQGQPGEMTISATRSDILDQTFDFNKDTGTTTIHFTKHPYVPLKAYKALLKMALGFVAEADIPRYRMAFEFLNSAKYDRVWHGFPLVYRYYMPYTCSLEKPSIFLYRKRNPSDHLYTHVFILNALNSIFQFIIPFYAEDLRFANIAPGPVVPWAPPIFGIEYPFPMDTIRSEQLDFSSADTVKNEKGSVAWGNPEEKFETRAIVNEKTGEVMIEPFDASLIRGIELFRTPLAADPKKANP